MTLLTSKEVAARLGISENTLRVWRMNGRGPNYVKSGESQQAAVRYPEEEVARWAQRSLRSRT